MPERTYSKTKRKKVFVLQNLQTTNLLSNLRYNIILNGTRGERRTETERRTERKEDLLKNEQNRCVILHDSRSQESKARTKGVTNTRRTHNYIYHNTEKIQYRYKQAVYEYGSNSLDKIKSTTSARESVSQSVS
jgi:hypothetical protein